MRKLYYRLTFFLFTLLTFSQFSQAQSVSGVEVSIVEDNLQITYAMSGLRNGQKFDVELYSSLDNYAAPLTDERITGALGKDIALNPGNQIIISDPLETLGAITGDLNFKVRATLIFNPVSVIDPVGFFKQKRGKKFTTVWNGGLAGETVNFDLYRDNQLILDDFHSTINNRSAEFKFPKQSLGTGYTMKMQFESLNEDIALPDFEVKRKKSIAGRVIGILVLAAAVDFALYGTSAGDAGFLAEKSVRTDDFNSFFFGKIFDPMGMTNNDLPAPPGTPDQFRAPLLTIPFN